MNAHRNQGSPVSEKGGSARNTSSNNSNNNNNHAKTPNNNNSKKKTQSTAQQPPLPSSSITSKQTSYRLPVFLQEKIKDKGKNDQNYETQEQEQQSYFIDDKYLVIENENVHLKRVIDVEQRTSKELLRMLYQTQVQLEQATEQIKSEHTQRMYLENQLKNSQYYSQPPPSLIVTSFNDDENNVQHQHQHQPQPNIDYNRENNENINNDVLQRMEQIKQENDIMLEEMVKMQKYILELESTNVRLEKYVGNLIQDLADAKQDLLGFLWEKRLTPSNPTGSPTNKEEQIFMRKYVESDQFEISESEFNGKINLNRGSPERPPSNT